MVGIYQGALVGLFLISVSTIFQCGTAMAYEEPEYKVIAKDGNFELREYVEHIIAETTVEGDFREAGNRGFRRLFDYISGNNRSRKSVSMTAPVSQEAFQEKITMTVPVSQERQGNRWRISFFMPSKYTLETLPEPLDPEVQILKVPARLFAVLRYSGTWSERRYERNKQLLYKLLADRGLIPTGEPILARYNSPFSLWFLRRNEVLIEVQKGK